MALFVYLCFDAVVYAAAVFFVVEAALMVTEGAFGIGGLATRILVSLAAVAVSARLSNIVRPILARKARLPKESAIFILLTVVVPLVLSRLPTSINPGTKSSTSLMWLPIEWHKLPMNIALIALTFPAVACMAAAAAFWPLTRASGSGADGKTSVAVYCLGAALLIVSRLTVDTMGSRAHFFKMVFGGPWLAMAWFSWRGAWRAYSRTGIIAAALTVLWSFYTAVVPWSPLDSASLPAGSRILYPQAGQTSQFPLEYVRELYVDSDRRELYASYGPTSGIIRLNLVSGALDLLTTEGLVRGFWTRSGEPEIYAVDWIFDTLWRVDKRTFSLQHVRQLLDPVLIAPVDIVGDDQSLYVVSSEYPAVTILNRVNLEVTAQFNFKALGITAFSSGAWTAALDPMGGNLFIEVGMTGLDDRFTIVKLGGRPPRILQTGSLPGGGLQMIPIPEHRCLLIAHFYSDRIFEIDMDTLKIRRTINAALNSRSLAYDAARDRIYAAGYLTGQFVAIEYSTGKILDRAWVGKKPSVMYLSDVEDALYVVGSLGIIRVDLQTLAGGFDARPKDSGPFAPD